MKARGLARHNLVRTSGTDFQREAIGLLSEVLEGSTERRYRDELLNDLEDLRRSGKVSEVLLLDLDPFMTKVQALAIRRLAAWAKDQSELFEYYNERLRFTDYLPDVPFTSGIPARNPVGYIARRVTEFFSKLPPHQTGRYRPAPKLLIPSSFGFGKTRTLHAVAGEWVRAGCKL